MLARRSFRGSGLLEAVVDLPIVLPPAVAGLGLLLVFGRRGLLGEPLATVRDLDPVHDVRRDPRAGLRLGTVLHPLGADRPRERRRELEDAARVDGAGELYLFRRITVPFARAALAAGLVMTWARSLGEFGATIMFAGNIPGKTQTLPLVVYSEFNSGDLDASIAAAAILVLAAFGVLIAVRVLTWGRVLDDRSLG